MITYTVPNETSVTIKHRTQDDNIYTVPNEMSVTILQFHKNVLCMFYIMVKANVNVIMKNLSTQVSCRSSKTTENVTCQNESIF